MSGTEPAIVTEPRIADLVLEGGGVKGIGLVGAISVFESRGWKFNRVAGTSAGAIVGALVAAGFSASELTSIMHDVDYLKFRDGGGIVDHLGVFGHAVSLLIEKGIYEGNYLKEWLGGLLHDKKRVDTFAQLPYVDTGRELAADERYRLVVMTSDISQGCLRRFPWDYGHYGLEAGQQRVVDAVRASMSIPFFYEPVRLDAKDGATSWLVDGGMLSNYPIDVFDRHDGRAPRFPTFGIKLSAKPDSNLAAAKPIDGVLGMAKAMIGTMTGFYDQMHLDDPTAVARTIFVDTTGVQATNFDLDVATRDRLFTSGQNAAIKFLDGGDGQPPWNWQGYLDMRDKQEKDRAAALPPSVGP